MGVTMVFDGRRGDRGRRRYLDAGGLGIFGLIAALKGNWGS